LATAVDESPQLSVRRRSGPGLLGKLLLIFLLYALSPGPVITVVNWVDYGCDTITGTGPLFNMERFFVIISTVYYPLHWLEDHVEIVDRFYEWYDTLNLWDHLQPSGYEW